MTAGEEEKSAFPISSPLFSPPRFFSLSEALGCESHFLSSPQNGPRVSGGGGERVGREAAAAGTRFIFHPGFLLAACAGGRGRESSGPAARPGRRPGPLLGARLPAGPSLPRRRPGAPPRTRGRARMSPRGARRTRGPARRLLRPLRPGRRGQRLWWHYFDQECAGPMRFAPLESPRIRGLAEGGGGGGWKVLRWRWAWPVARAGGAVAPRAPSSPAARAAPFVGASPASAP